MNRRLIDSAVILCLLFIAIFYSDFASSNTIGGGAGSIKIQDPIAGVLCLVVQELQGPVGKAIAVVAVIILGIGLFMGKISWPVALATAIGVGLIFGSDQIVAWIGTATGSTNLKVC